MHAWISAITRIYLRRVLPSTDKHKAERPNPKNAHQIAFDHCPTTSETQHPLSQSSTAGTFRNFQRRTRKPSEVLHVASLVLALLRFLPVTAWRRHEIHV